MIRIILIIICGTVIGVEMLALTACWRTVRPPSERPARIDDSVVALNDGSVLLARPGTLSRDMIDWFNDVNARPRRFDLGSVRFLRNSAQPAPDSEVRLQRFTAELKASPTVKAKVLLCTSASSDADASLAALRAERLSNELIANGIDRGRISAEACQLKQTRGIASASERDQQVVSVLLERGT
jgi:hypothetical protein